jgi:hypothetical protein
MTPVRPTRLLVALALACTLGPAAAQGQTVYRCGADGRQFSDQPCAGGQPLDVTQAPRPAADLADARARAQREQRQAALLDAQARQQAAHTGAAGVHGSRLRPGGAERKPAASADSRLNRRAEDRRQPATPGDESMRQVRSPHRLAAAGTSP